MRSAAHGEFFEPDPGAGIGVKLLYVARYEPVEAPAADHHEREGGGPDEEAAAQETARKFHVPDLRLSAL